MIASTGGCLCGKVRYSYEGEPVLTGICHCRNCQKQAGTAFSVIIGVPKPAISVTGHLKTYNDVGDSGQAVHRNFCPECGSPVTTEVAVMPDLVFVKAGTLDDTSKLAPSMEIFCSSAQAWLPRQPNTQKFDKGPG
jgi:hypothetical protein